MEQDLDYSDLVETPKSKKEKQKKHRSESTGKRSPLLMILIVLVLVSLLGAGGYVVMLRPDLLPFLAQLSPAPSQEAAATPTPEAPQPTEIAAAAVTQEAAPTPTELPPTEAPVETAPEALLPLPEYGYLLENSSQPDAHEARAIELAHNTAVRDPFQWEYLEFEPGTLTKAVERYYIDLVNKDMGFLMTFNEKYPSSSLAVFKFKQDTRRITIQFFEGSEEQPPYAFLFYEGW